MPLGNQPSVYPLIVNGRMYVPGRLDCRAGILPVNSNSLAGFVHSLKRLNDPLPGATNAYGIIAGCGTNLWLGQVSASPSLYSQIDIGYSGNPLGFVPYRPPNSPESWLYISDSLQMRKIRTDGTVYPQGIAPPLDAPVVDFGQPLMTVIEDFNGASTGDWVSGGTAGPLSANSGQRITDTLTAPFNQGPGWVEYLEYPSAPLKSGYGRGMLLVLDTTPSVQDVVAVSGIYPASINTSILAIEYDNGNTGPCCIVPVTPSTLVTNLALRGLLSKISRTWADPFTAGANLQIQPNSIFNLSGGTPAAADVLVLSSTPGPLGTFSVRASTPVTHAAGEILTAVSSFRSWDVYAHSNPLAAQAGYFESTIASGIGTISNSLLSVDLSVISDRPTQPSDEIHLSVRLDAPANLTEGRILLDVDSALNNFTRNYYYASFKASDLTPAVAGTSTTQAAIQQSISSAQIDQFNADNPGGFFQQVTGADSPTDPTSLASASVQSGTGDSQWTELFIPVSNLIRVGTDTSRTLANVKAAQIYFNVSADTVCDVHGLYIKGSYGPDVGTVGSDYYYRYRRRSSTTGAESNPSPYNRSGLRPHNQRVQITVPGDATEADQLDIFRWGGSVTSPDASGNVPWFYIGSVNNPGPSQTAIFNDDFSDSDILNAETLEFDNEQPYSTIDTPKKGFCTVVGTSVIWQSGDLFNTRWGPGSIIEINGVPYTLYRQPQSTTFLEIVESATTIGGAEKVTTVLRPTSFQQGSIGPPFNNPGYAYDQNPMTAATVDVAPPEMSAFGIWVIPIPAVIAESGSITLSVLSYSEDNTDQQNGQTRVYWSTDFNGHQHTIWQAGDHGSASSPALDSVTVPLDSSVTELWLSVLPSVPGGDTGGPLSVGINEIYATAVYIPTVLDAVPFILRQPTLLAQPMYAQWGPFLGYIQAVGDDYQPGVMHCTKPNQPDSSSALLDVEITPPSEPLMNGCMYGNGSSFVWSNQRMFQLAASSDLGLQFTPTGGASTSVPFVPQEVTGAQGLFSPWWFCVGDKIYYGTTSGIVATTGGTPSSITDPYLSLLFPHDGRPGVPVTVGSVTFQPPDFTQTQALRLFYEKNHVKFSYIDINGKKQTIVYSVILGVWTQDDYITNADPEIVCCYSEEGPSVNRNLVGGLDFIYQESGDLESGNASGFQARMAQVSDFPGFAHVREAYVGLMSITPAVLDVIADGTIYSQVLDSTGGTYQKAYTPLGPAKGKAFEWSFTSPTSARLFLKDCFGKIKPWAGEDYSQFEMFREINRGTKP